MVSSSSNTLVFRCFHSRTHCWNTSCMLLRMITAYLWMWMMSENLWPFRAGCKFGNNRIHNGEWIVQLRYRVLAISLRLASMSNPEALSRYKINASGQSSGLLRWNNSRNLANNFKQKCRVTVSPSYKELKKNNVSQSCIIPCIPLFNHKNENHQNALFLGRNP